MATKWLHINNTIRVALNCTPLLSQPSRMAVERDVRDYAVRREVGSGSFASDRRCPNVGLTSNYGSIAAPRQTSKRARNRNQDLWRRRRHSQLGVSYVERARWPPHVGIEPNVSNSFRRFSSARRACDRADCRAVPVLGSRSGCGQARHPRHPAITPVDGPFSHRRTSGRHERALERTSRDIPAG